MKSRVPVGDYRVYVDLMLNSRRPDFVNRMISTIPLGVLAGLASIPTVLPGVYRVRVDLMLDSRRPDFVNRVISTISLGVLAGLASISLFSREIMPMPINSSQSPVPDRLSDRSCCIWPHSAVPLAFGRSSRIRPFPLIRPYSAALDCTRRIAPDRNPRI